MRNLVIVLGDQLDPHSAAFDGFAAGEDRIWMAELPAESEHVWSHKTRTALFLSAMRHFADALDHRRYAPRYLKLREHPHHDFKGALTHEIRTLDPERLVVVEPGDHRVLGEIKHAAANASIPLEIRPDRSFMCSLDAFNDWARGRKGTRLEHFYRHMRQRTGILMSDRQPVGGAWNYDAQNRQTFGRRGPGEVPAPRAFAPDGLTREALETVETHFTDHPGRLARFDWPVTPADAQLALDDFIGNRLPEFGPYQDALWTDEPYLYHSRLSAALNLKLISPRSVIDAAVAAYDAGQAPLASVEGFVRQILGWRELVRGLYWRHMPEYRDANTLSAHRPLPACYWTGETDMRCLSEVIGQTLEFGYAHHIQRLMITGLFALLLGVEPRAVHEWYLAVYVDAVEWVELPNTIGMSQFADGGIIASKPYVATGKYIKRMSNYCTHCRYDPDEALGEAACPFTTLYWDFLIRHEARFHDHPRAAMQWRNLDRLDAERRAAIRRQASRLASQLEVKSV